MTLPESACERASGGARAVNHRHRAVMRSAMTVSWLWLVPLAGVAAVAGYLSLLFMAFRAEGLGGETTTWDSLLAVGTPALAFLLAAAAGLGTAWAFARWTGRMTPLARVYPWLLGAMIAILAALVAATAFYTAMSGADRLSSNWL